MTHATGGAAGRKRCLRIVWIYAAMAALALSMGVPASRAQTSDETFSSSDGGAGSPTLRSCPNRNCYAACGAEKWYRAAPPENQAKAEQRGCLRDLENAKERERAALEVLCADDRSERVDEFNGLIKQRTTHLDAFKSCATDSWRRRPGEEEFASTDQPAQTGSDGRVLLKGYVWKGDPPPEADGTGAGDPLAATGMFLQGFRDETVQQLAAIPVVARAVWTAGVQMSQGDFIAAEKTLGLKRGEGTVLRQMKEELSDPSVGEGASAEDVGHRLARRIIAFGLPAGAAGKVASTAGTAAATAGKAAAGKAAAGMSGMIKSAKNVMGKGRRVQGTAKNPLRGADIRLKAIEVPKELPGRHVRPARGLDPTTYKPVAAAPETWKVGKYVGEGRYGVVYEKGGGRLQKLVGKHPEHVIKIDKTGGEAALLDQAKGYNLTKDAGIPTVKIEEVRVSGPSDTSYLIAENLNGGRWRDMGARTLETGKKLTRDEFDAVSDLYKQLDENGIVWADGRPDNIFVFEEGTTLKAGVLDHGKMMNKFEFNTQQGVDKFHVPFKERAVAGGALPEPAFDTANAALFQHWFGAPLYP